MSFKVGDQVVFLGCSKEQIYWGSNDDPNPILTINDVYEVSDVDIHSYHTKISLTDIPGRFNSVCFDYATQKEN